MGMVFAIDCKRRLGWLGAAVLAPFMLFGQVNPTYIVGPVFDAFGNPYTGSFTVQSQAKTDTGYAITGTVRIVYVTGGVIQSFNLVPNDTSTPNLTSYALQYANGDRWTCIVPTVAAPVSTTVTTTQNSKTITVSSATGLAVGQLVSAVGVPGNTTLTALTGATGTLSLAATATNSVPGTFYTTVPYTQVCSPGTIPPNVAMPISVSQILPSPVNGSVITTLNGVTAWSNAPPGTVSSVGLSLPSIFSVTNSPVTTTGVLTGAFVNQNPGTFFAGPVSGIASTPAFRTIAPTDLPIFNSTNSGTVPASGGGSSTYLRADGSWVTPPYTPPNTAATNQILTSDGAGGFVGTSATTGFLGTSVSLPGASYDSGSTSLYVGRQDALTTTSSGVAQALMANYNWTGTSTSSISHQAARFGFYTDFASTGNITSARASYHLFRHYGSGTITTASGAATQIGFGSAPSATITDAAGFRVLGLTGSGGTITSLSGFSYVPNTSSITVTNHYGVYVGALTQGTNKWSFYALSDPAYFGGGLTSTSVTVSGTQAVINSGFGTGSTVSTGSNQYGGVITIGASGSSSGVIGQAQVAPHQWVCQAQNITKGEIVQCVGSLSTLTLTTTTTTPFSASDVISYIAWPI